MKFMVSGGIDEILLVYWPPQKFRTTEEGQTFNNPIEQLKESGFSLSGGSRF
jgi:hypothetical protein